MRGKIWALVALLCSAGPSAHAAPHTFTSEDYIEYGIYFAPRGNFRGKAHKLLDLRFGNIEGYYARYLPRIKDIPSRRQRLKLVTSRGSVRVNRPDDAGVTVTRDTWNEKKRRGTKRLEVRFENAQCTNAQKLSSPCVVDLLLTTDAPDVGVVHERRTLEITSSTGLSFRYRTIRRDGGKPLNRAAINRSPVVNNYAWEWRPSVDKN
jgi:hypothetical protein